MQTKKITKNDIKQQYMQLINYDRKLDLLQKFSKTNVQQKNVVKLPLFCTMLGVTSLSVNRFIDSSSRID